MFNICESKYCGEDLSIYLSIYLSDFIDLPEEPCLIFVKVNIAEKIA